MPQALFLPCAHRAAFPDDAAAQRRLLGLCGIQDLAELPAFCCGQPAATAGDREGAAEMVRSWRAAAARFDRVFVEQLRNLASPGDLLVAISGSGNSANILAAVEWANRHGLSTFGCTGFTGGKLRGLAHRGLHVDLDDMGIVETLHLAAFHWVVDDLHRRISM